MTSPLLQLHGIIDVAGTVESVENGEVTRVLDGVPVESFGSDEAEWIGYNRVVEFEGDIFTFTNGIINKSLGGTGVLEDQFGSLTSTGRFNCWGLWPVVVTGIPYLYAFYGTSSNFNTTFWRKKRSKIFSDGAWEGPFSQSVSPTIGSVSSHGTWNGATLYQNKLYMAHWDNTSKEFWPYAVFNFDTDTWSSVDHPTSPSGASARTELPYSICAYNNRVYMVLRDNTNSPTASTIKPSGGTVYIQRVDNTTAPSVELILATNVSAPIDINSSSTRRAEGRCTMFVDKSEDKMYAIYHLLGSGEENFKTKRGWAVYEIGATGNNGIGLFRDVSSVLSPLGIDYPQLEDPTLGSSDKESQRFFSYNIVNSSGTEDIVLEFAQNGTFGTESAFYKWNGPDAAITELGFGGSASAYRHVIKQGEGYSIYAPIKPFDVTFIVESTNTPGTMRLRYSILGSGQDCSIRFLVGNEGEPLTQIATLTNPSEGSIVGNAVTGITADSGVIRTVDWVAQLDGISQGGDFGMIASAKLD